jgi:hypothetical protein
LEVIMSQKRNASVAHASAGGRDRVARSQISPSDTNSHLSWRATVLGALQHCPDDVSAIGVWLQSAITGWANRASRLPDPGIPSPVPKLRLLIALQQDIEQCTVATFDESRMMGELIQAMQIALIGGEARALLLTSPTTMATGHVLLPALAWHLERLCQAQAGPASSEIGSDGGRSPVRLVPMAVQGGYLDFLHCLFRALALPVPRPGEKRSMEVAVDTVLAAIESQHIVCLVITDLTSVHMTPDFGRVCAFLEAMRRRRVVLVLSATPAIALPAGRAIEQLADLRCIQNFGHIEDCMTVATHCWYVLGGSEKIPTDLAGRLMEVFGQRKWIPDVVLAASVQRGYRERSGPKAVRVHTEGAGASQRRVLAMWDRWTRGSLTTGEWRPWADWLPSPVRPVDSLACALWPKAAAK